MESFNIHQAKTQLSKLLALVVKGSNVLITKGKEPIAMLTPVPFKNRRKKRPKIGVLTSEKFSVTKDAFSPLNESELKDWGLK